METRVYVWIAVGIILIEAVRHFAAWYLKKHGIPSWLKPANDNGSLFSHGLSAAEVQQLLDAGAEPTARDQYGRTPLMIQHEAEAVAVLEEAGVNPCAVDNSGWNMIHHAAYDQGPDVMHIRAILELALRSGLDLNELTGSDKQSPMYLAVQEDAYETVQLLLEYGASATTEGHFDDFNDGQFSSLEYAATINENSLITMMLLAAGARDAEVDDGWTPLHQACATGDCDSVRALLVAGAGVNARSVLDCTPLMAAAFFGHADVAKLLLQAGAATEARCKDAGIFCSITPLFMAAVQGHTDVIRVLLEHGASVDARSSDKDTPLMWACRNEHADAVKLLLQAGANPNASTADGSLKIGKSVIITPLLQADENQEIRELLLSYGAKNEGRCRL